MIKKVEQRIEQEEFLLSFSLIYWEVNIESKAVDVHHKKYQQNHVEVVGIAEFSHNF